ncbi:MAG TPA: hypothetical protein VK427_21205 [Kofleriaceae bacterium]|nr:hypothetical protein [Kofleriaceae bacterium]
MRFVLVALLAAAAFVGGRWLGGHAAAPRGAAPARVTPSQRAADVQSTPPPIEAIRRPVAVVPVSAWERAMRERPEATQALHAAVIDAMEPRRQRIDWKRCRPADAIGRSSLVFVVELEQTATRARVRDVTFSRVDEGVVIDSEVGACIARDLAGSFELAADAQLVPGVSSMDYRFTVDFGS